MPCQFKLQLVAWHMQRLAGYENTANMRTECVCTAQASRRMKRNKALRNGWCVGVKMTELIIPLRPTYAFGVRKVASGQA